jgi:hypothetical protein
MPIGRRDIAWFLAGLLSAAAIALFAWLVSPSPPTGAPAGGAAVTGGAPATGGGGIAARPDASAPNAGGSMDDMLARLETRLASQGGTDADWELLAQSYEVVGRAADAQSARAHHVSGAPASASPGATAPVPASPGAAASAASAASADAAQLDGVVEIADQLKSSVPAGVTLFIVAKAVNSPGPPVGVMRTTTSQWPVRFRLDDASAMVPGRTLSSAGSVTVQARISRSGMAAPQPGDFQSGVSTVNPHDRKSLRLLIDQVIGQGQ